MCIVECEPHIQILLLQATFKGWMDIMYAAVDNVNVSIGQYYTKLIIFKVPQFSWAIFKQQFQGSFGMYTQNEELAPNKRLAVKRAVFGDRACSKSGALVSYKLCN